MQEEHYAPNMSTPHSKKRVVECYSSLLSLETATNKVLFYYPELVVALANEDAGFKNQLISNLGETETELFLKDPKTRLANVPSIKEEENIKFLIRELLYYNIDELILMARATYSATGNICDPSDLGTRLMLSSLVTRADIKKPGSILYKLSENPGEDGLAGIPDATINDLLNPPGPSGMEKVAGFEQLKFTKDGHLDLVSTKPEALYELLSQAFYVDLVTNLVSDEKTFKKIKTKIKDNKVPAIALAVSAKAGLVAGTTIVSGAGPGALFYATIINASIDALMTGGYGIRRIYSTSDKRKTVTNGREQQSKLVDSSLRLKRAIKDRGLSI